MKRTYDLRVCTLFMCVKSNEASRRNYRLQEKKIERSVCDLRQACEILITINCLNLYYKVKRVRV